jgi:alpha-methylacyl-CoA racemase
MAGHDLNYAAIAGALGMIGRPDTPPAIAMNFIADYAGGGLMAAFAITAALLARERSGQGQTIDVAMTDGTLSMLTKLAGQFFENGTIPERGAHRINGGAPYYDVYPCADGRYLAVGALEPRFFQNFCAGIDRPELAPLQNDRAQWPELRRALAARIAERSRDEWFATLRDADACVTPVYALDEALDDPHNRAREMIASHPHPTLGTLREMAPAPRLDRTPPARYRNPPRPGEHAREILVEAGYDEPAIAALFESKAAASG